MPVKNLVAVTITLLMALSGSSIFAGAIDNINAANEEMGSLSVPAISNAANSINVANRGQADEISTTKSVRGQNQPPPCKILIPIIFTASNKTSRIGGFILGDDNDDSSNVIPIALSKNQKLGIPLKNKACWRLLVPDLAKVVLRNLMQSLYGKPIIFLKKNK